MNWFALHGGQFMIQQASFELSSNVRHMQLGGHPHINMTRLLKLQDGMSQQCHVRNLLAAQLQVNLACGGCVACVQHIQLHTLLGHW